ncbi:MAG: hydantoinase B/oxoprolinase family protein [Cyclobacteriaceae bacterium]|nr:hydantoinase B/oxoprolinase family protein [Cyclobacteriaceae bacterium]
MSRWKIWMDTGGTFTDCIAIDPNQKYKRLKVLSSGVIRGVITHQLTSHSLQLQIQWPLDKDIFKDFHIHLLERGVKTKIQSIDLQRSIVYTYQALKNVDACAIEISSHEEVPVFVARLITQTSLSEKFPIIEMKLGSTRGTNALLERKGAKTAFITTKGFKDLLLIGTQQRPDLFALKIEKEKPLYSHAIEVSEKISSDGIILTPLSKTEIQRLVIKLKKIKIDSIAIAFLNSYKNPTHELFLAQALAEAGFNYVSSSHALANQIKILPRAETAVANAYLAPIINAYLSNIQSGIDNVDLKVMNSAGGLNKIALFQPKDSLLSGPAGGVVGAATAAKRSSISKLITFDMGGTSTDVSLYNNRFDYRFESKVGQTKILSPSISIETIAAGGGSICEFDGHRLTVGPHSAGASPGPACYGAGGPLTITDVNLLLGRLKADFFSIPIYEKKAETALNRMLTKIQQLTRKKVERHALLESFIQIANEKMVDTIKQVSIQQGHNPGDYTLLSFGGAGGQHACALADMLDMNKILIPYDAGLLSAYGIGHAKIERFEEKLILNSLSRELPTLEKTINQLFQIGKQKLLQEDFSEADITNEKKLIFLRFKGQETTLEIEFESTESIFRLFRKKYVSIYGHWIKSREIEVESIRVILSIKTALEKKIASRFKKYKPRAKANSTYLNNGKLSQISIFEWERLTAGATITGPAIVVSKNSTTLVEANWKFQLNRNNNGILVKKSGEKPDKTRFDNVASLELFSNRFTAIAQEMGAMLQRTSFSVNVKERLDFSCAVLDANGYLIVNAPHIPVHLGSMGVCVREVMKLISMKEGDVVITNHPAFGGSHLPDVTLIKPVFYKRKLIGFVANRAHHAEIGGMKPGSMPVDATCLEEEGVIIAPTFLIKSGKPRWKEIETIFLTAKYPTRSINENIADLNGALASVNLGEKNLQELCVRFGASAVTAQMTELKNYAAELLDQKIRTSKKQSFQATEYLDDGSRLKVKINFRSNQLIFDFSGSAKIHPQNLNATKAIVQSVVLYVLRLWVDKPIAMNEGLMQNVKLILPKGLLNSFDGFVAETEAKLPAVVGGNTEVSQRLTDTLIKAFQLSACSQGTMNNFLFGNDKLGFYETICGGTGAGNGFHGVDAVHSHMTNTRITDPEVLEHRYPVRLNKFEIRKNSGGKGKWSGGNGAVREIQFKEKMDVNILSQHRIEKPFGATGAAAGKKGEQSHTSNAGKITPLKGMVHLTVNAGDKITIKTPGGGGWGKLK